MFDMRATACNKQSGFTLVELLVTVAVVGILAAIAIPSYESYVTKSKIKGAQSDLAALSLVMENFYQKQLKYPTNTASTTAESRCVAATGTTTCSVSGWQPSQDGFVYKIVTATASTYKLEALGSSGKVNGCSITLTQDNVRAIASCSGYNGGWQ